MNEAELSEIASHLQLVAGVEFVALRGGLALGQVRVRTADGEVVMDVRRDLQSADSGDAEFIANTVADLRCLLDAVHSGHAPSSAVAREISERVAGASPAPWRAFIESGGGQGGCDVLQVSDRDDEADMYLWIGGDLAPSDYFRFIAAARQDIPRLLEAVQVHDRAPKMRPRLRQSIAGAARGRGTGIVTTHPSTPPILGTPTGRRGRRSGCCDRPKHLGGGHGRPDGRAHLEVNDSSVAQEWVCTRGNGSDVTGSRISNGVFEKCIPGGGSARDRGPRTPIGAPGDLTPTLNESLRFRHRP